MLRKAENVLNFPQRHPALIIRKSTSIMVLMKYFVSKEKINFKVAMNINFLESNQKVKVQSFTDVICPIRSQNEAFRKIIYTN